jgi:hypothetical protein
MTTIKLESKLVMYNLSATANMGPLQVELIAQVIDCGDGELEIEFMDYDNPTLNGVQISSFKKFINANKEFGIDYVEVLNKEFNKIFTQDRVKEIVG